MLHKLKNADIYVLFQYLVPHQKRYLIYLILGALFGAVARNLISISLNNVVLAATEKDAKHILGLVVLNVLSVLLLLVSSFPMLGLQNCVSKMTARIRQATFTKVGKLPVSFYEENLSGDVISKVSNDVNTFKPLFGDLFPSVVNIFIFGIVSIVTALMVNWWLAIIISVLGMLFKLLNDYLSKAVKKYSNTAYEKNALLVQELISILTGNTIIKIFGLEEKTYQSYRDINQNFTDTSITLAFKKSLQNTCNALMTSFLNVFTLMLGAYLVFNDIVPLATVLVVNSLSFNISMLFRWTGQIFSEAVATSVAGMRIHKLLQTEDEPSKFHTPEASPSSYEIEFKEVAFSYDNKNVLDHISLGISQNSVTALVGESGGGKSTIMKLLLGFYQINSGNIWVRGRCLADYTLEELRNQFAYVSQESYLFDASIEDNIRYGNQAASKEEMIEAAKAAYAHDFIMEQENGYATMVGERAVRLSGGQKQRIAIARAILKNAPILLLDEATSSLDTESQEIVQKALGHLMENKTTIVIAHRLSTIENADEILVIHHGQVAEKGKHKELLKLGEQYHELYNLQLRNS